MDLQVFREKMDLRDPGDLLEGMVVQDHRDCKETQAHEAKVEAMADRELLETQVQLGR